MIKKLDDKYGIRRGNILNLIVILLILTSVIIFEFTLNKNYLGSDDAYIHLRYIDNIRSGHGFGFNPDSPSNGSTSPLWVILVSYVVRFAGDLPSAVKTLSVLIFLISILCFYLISRQLTGSVFLAILGTIIFASDPWLLKWGGSVMEASLAALLSLVIAALILRSESLGYMTLTSFILGIATLVRPEFFLLFLILLLLQLISVKNLTEKFRRIAVALVTYSFCLVPWFVFSLITFGTPIPNTFFAKTLYASNAIKPVALYFLSVIGLSYVWAFMVIGVSLLVIVIRIVSKNEQSELGYSQYALASLWLWVFILPLYYITSRLQTPSTRYLQITSPIFILLSFILLIKLINQFFSRTGLGNRLEVGIVKRSNILISEGLIGTRGVILTILLLTMVIVSFNIVLNALVVLPSSYEFSEGVLSTYQKVGKWLKTNTNPEDDIAIAIDVGAIGYFSQRQIIDLGGLNTAEALDYLPDTFGYVFISEPEFLVITGEKQQYSLLENSRFSALALPVYSLPIDTGIRADLQKSVGVRPKLDQWVTVYRLNW